jgi:DNA-directed RNA polymerase specialized sigma24 family protein
MHIREMYINGVVTDRAVTLVALCNTGFTFDEAEVIVKSITVQPQQRQQWTRWTDAEKDLLRKYRAEGKSLKEIAAALGKTIKQVQSAITRFQPQINSTYYPSA